MLALLGGKNCVFSRFLLFSNFSPTLILGEITISRKGNTAAVAARSKEKLCSKAKRELNAEVSGGIGLIF